jgi:FMN phosphatase YigB (HAD superfamily)
VLARLGVAPEQTLHVGDSLRADVVGAAGLGIRTAWLTRRVKDPRAALEAFEGPAPDFTIRDLAELPHLLGA